LILTEPSVSSFSQLRCAHLVPAKAPLPEEAIFNRNKAVVERRRATCKAQHKEREIAKRDQNDNCIKRWKTGERDVSSNEDPSLEPSWSGDVASAAVDWSDMSGSSTSSPPRAIEVTSSRRPQIATREKKAGSSSRSAARHARVDQQVVRPHVTPGGPSAPEARRDPPRQDDPPRLFDDSDRPDADSLQRRRSRARSTDSVSTPSAPQEADSDTAPRCLQSLLIRGSGALDVHVSLATGGGQGPTLAVAEVGRSAPKQSGERSAAVKAVTRSGAAPFDRRHRIRGGVGGRGDSRPPSSISATSQGRLRWRWCLRMMVVWRHLRRRGGMMSQRQWRRSLQRL
jgi:hypothetical protein